MIMALKKVHIFLITILLVIKNIPTTNKTNDSIAPTLQPRIRDKIHTIPHNHMFLLDLLLISQIYTISKNGI